MGNTLRCCLACVLPCGALDLIRIVHLNGYIEEISGPITAGEILKNNPNHVLSRPSSQGVVRRILILSPESELKRGTIYFLIPASSMPPEKKKSRDEIPMKPRRIKIKSDADPNKSDGSSDRYQNERVSEKRSANRDRRRRSVCEWRPHLQSISED